MQHQKPESGSSAIANLLFNIVLPVILLEKLSDRFGADGPLIALIVALSFPLGYGLFEYLKFKKRNWISLLGFLNVLLTGGFALMSLEGIWFAVKEASIPLLIGLFVLASAYRKKPFIEILIYNPNFMDIERMEKELQERGNERAFHKHLRNSTLFLAGSFFLSAVLNFVLASLIFTKIDPSLELLEQQKILNSQISEMTWKSYLVIMLPSMICLFLILRYLALGISKFTGLKFTEVLLVDQK